MKSDFQIQKDVISELKWEPILEPGEIGVFVKHGIVTLSGIVDSYLQKRAAVKATKRVVGVKAVAEDIQVGVSPDYRKTDTEIAAAVLQTLKWHPAVPDEKIKIDVEDGRVTLEGEVKWEYQRLAAVKAIQNLVGVRTIVNLMTVEPKDTSLDIKQHIIDAFKRNAILDTAKITVEVLEHKAILAGKVRSFTEKEAAEKAVWSAPGVNCVDNRIEIIIPEYEYEE